MASNGSKPYHALQIRSLGFEVPETMITTDPDEVAKFAKRHEKVIYKSISGVRSVVSKLTEQHQNRLQDVCWCPTQFQEFVPGTDYRVHIVGEEVFTSEIISEADDYRYASHQGETAEIRASDVPEEVAERCVAISREMGLAVSGVDLRRTPEGKWYCFEVNPSPGFTFYQDATGQRIDEAIARLLIKGLP
jgi:glutathione synthase/RimK-type ligase-like ATP-grasp enzyme